MKPPFLFFSVHPPFWCQRFVLNVNNLARSNNKSMLTLTLAPFVPIMLLPSAEDLCIFDIKFLLSSRLLSCWLFLTRRPRSPNFPIFNAGHAHPPPPDSFRSAATKFCGTSFVGMCCLHCSWTSVCCPVPILYFEAHWTMFPSNNALLFTNWVAPVHSGSDLADGCLDIVGWGWGVLPSTTWSLSCEKLTTTCVSVRFGYISHSALTRSDGGPYLRHIWRPCRLDKPPSAAQLAN